MSEQNVALARHGYSPISLSVEQIRSALHGPTFALAAKRVFASTILLVLALILAATAWFSWILMLGAIGSRGTLIAVSSLVACAVAWSWRTGRSFVSSLIAVGCGGFALLFATHMALRDMH